jgi:hypothetical protein
VVLSRISFDAKLALGGGVAIKALMARVTHVRIARDRYAKPPPPI